MEKYKNFKGLGQKSSTQMQNTMAHTSVSQDNPTPNINSSAILNTDLITISTDPLNNRTPINPTKPSPIIAETPAIAGSKSHKISRPIEYNSSYDPAKDIPIKSSQIPMRNLSPKVLETWLNEILEDADYSNPLVKRDYKVPLSRYKIDRMQLSNAGIGPSDIDRLYRALFVYSVGFYELIYSITHAGKTPNQQKYFVISNIWKTYSVLLEYV